MKRIEMGRAFSASAVSLGCMRMASLDEKKVDAIMNAALDNGIDYFDHADIYGRGECERLFGEFLKRSRNSASSWRTESTGTSSKKIF